MLRQRRILCHCSVPQVRFIPYGFARLAREHFTKPSENRLFTKASKAMEKNGNKSAIGRIGSISLRKTPAHEASMSFRRFSPRNYTSSCIKLRFFKKLEF